MQHGEGTLNVFIKNLNNEFHPTIKFTAVYAEKSIEFLDVAINYEKKSFKDWFISKTDNIDNTLWVSCVNHPYLKSPPPH